MPAYHSDLDFLILFNPRSLGEFQPIMWRGSHRTNETRLFWVCGDKLNLCTAFEGVQRPILGEMY